MIHAGRRVFGSAQSQPLINLRYADINHVFEYLFRGLQVEMIPALAEAGKKYKHCCLAAAADSADSTEAFSWRRVRRALDEFGMASTMLDFVAETYGPDAFEEAWEEFSGTAEPFDPETSHIQVFMPWFFHRWSPDPYSTQVADAALHERSPTTLLPRTQRCKA